VSTVRAASPVIVLMPPAGVRSPAPRGDLAARE